MSVSNARLMALKDIAEWIEEQGYPVNGLEKGRNVWVVSAARIDTIEQRDLNKALGINRVNYFGNKNSKNK